VNVKFCEVGLKSSGLVELGLNVSRFGSWVEGEASLARKGAFVVGAHAKVGSHEDRHGDGPQIHGSGSSSIWMPEAAHRRCRKGRVSENAPDVNETP